MLWEHFVNWDKVLKHVEKNRGEIEVLNKLIGKKNFDSAFRKLVKKHPEIVKTLPMLAVRVGDGVEKFNILIDYTKSPLKFDEYDFTHYDEKSINKYLSFLEGTGIKVLLQDKKIKNIADYMLGVEAGLDSNARKNRAGFAMEKITEEFIKDFCEKRGYKYLKEANAKIVKDKFNLSIPVDKQNRRYDFVVNTKKGLIVFEVNFYNSKGGSKLKATAGEYIGLHKILKKERIKFIWVTDGPGWKSVKAGLHEAFEKMEYIFNLHLLEEGILLKEF